MVSHKSGGKPARARRLALRAFLRKRKSSLNSGAQPWYPPAKVPAVGAPTSMLDGVLDSAIFTLDVHVRYLEQRMAARLRVLEEGVSSKQQQPLATEKQHPLSAALPFILSALLFHCTVSTIALSQSQRADAVTSPETAGSDPRPLMNSRIKLPLLIHGGVMKGDVMLSRRGWRPGRRWQSLRMRRWTMTSTSTP